VPAEFKTPPTVASKFPGTEYVVLQDGRSTVPSAFTATGEPFPDRPGLMLELDVEWRWGSPRCVGLRMRPEDGGALSWKDVRRLPLDRLVEQATQVAASSVAFQGRMPDGGAAFQFYGTPDEAGVAREHVAGTTRRRAKLPPDHLERVAGVYKEAHANGKSPTKAVAIECGGGEHAYHSAKRWVGLARKAGHLPPTTPGRKAG
jgi:hypothetical protein